MDKFKENTKIFFVTLVLLLINATVGISVFLLLRPPDNALLWTVSFFAGIVSLSLVLTAVKDNDKGFTRFYSWLTWTGFAAGLGSVPIAVSSYTNPVYGLIVFAIIVTGLGHSLIKVFYSIEV